MSTIRVSVDELKDGDVLAEEIYLESSNISLVKENALIDENVKNKLVNADILEVKIYNSDTNEESLYDIKKDKFKEDYQKKVSGVKDIFKDVLKGDDIDIEKVSRISDDIFENVDNIYTAIESISELKDFDDYTYIHSVNVSLYSMLLGQWLKLDDEVIKDLVISAVLHDIGKAKIDDDILNKPGVLTHEEFDEMKKHPQYGYDLCKDISGLSDRVKEGILSHHEKMDGSGYPNALKDEDINLFSRIIAVCDIYDAITSERVYKNKITPFETFDEMIKSGYEKLDVNIMLTLFNNIGNLYVGLNVQMNTGEIGEIVYIPPQDISKPLIKVKEKFIDLSKDANYRIEKIV